MNEMQSRRRFLGRKKNETTGLMGIVINEV
jgi:hypothetical protein